MKKMITAVVGLICLTLASLGFASADYASKEKGWHKGFYALANVGMMNIDKDTNVLTNRAFGSDIILGYGLTFGWNFLDFLAAELDMRYGSEKFNNQKEHAANIDINVKYSLILNALTQWEKIRFLPYAKVGGGIFGAAVPDTSAGNDRFGVYGPSMNIGVGLETLILHYLYVGVDFTEHFVWLQSKSNSAGQKILNGGFDPQYSVFGHVGVHF